MNFLEGLEFFARFLWPVLLAWNVYLFRRTSENRDDLNAFRLHVAEKYTCKADIQKMFDDLEERLDQRLNQFVMTIRQ